MGINSINIIIVIWYSELVRSKYNKENKKMTKKEIEEEKLKKEQEEAEIEKNSPAKEQ